jgi:hypothetical protein
MKNIDKCYIIICLYIDDMLILVNNYHMIKSTKKIWTNKCNMKDLSFTDVILKIKIYKTFDGLLC